MSNYWVVRESFENSLPEFLCIPDSEDNLSIACIDCKHHGIYKVQRTISRSAVRVSYYKKTTSSKLVEYIQ